MMDPNQDKGMFRHILIDPGYKRMGQGASLTHTRVSNEVASQWMARTRVLFDSITDGRGHVTKVARYPKDYVPDPDEHLLKQTPGAYEAWKGLHALSFQVCQVCGSKVMIDPEKLAAFQHAPVPLNEELCQLESIHKKSYEDLLAFMAEKVGA